MLREDCSPGQVFQKFLSTKGDENTIKHEGERCPEADKPSAPEVGKLRLARGKAPSHSRTRTPRLS